MIPHLSVTPDELVALPSDAAADGQWLFRVDHANDFRLIPDGCFRMRRWDPGMHNRAQLLPTHQQLAAGMGLYRMCFFTSWGALMRNARFAVRESQSYIFTRMPIAAVAGVARSADEEVADDEQALLLTRVEPIDPSRPDWSTFSIPFTTVQQLHAGGYWQTPR